MDYEGSTATLERADDLGTSPASVVKRWLMELKLADKREKEWREKSAKIWDKYTQRDAKKHTFNILWSNTETLRPAVYNSLPQPDVRRRYKDEDIMGKAVAEVLKRGLTYGLDVGNFDQAIQHCVLDMLLPGRGVARVRYVPTLAQVGVTEDAHIEEAEDQAHESLEGDIEEVEWEQSTIEHVQWDDFRVGPGKEWSEVCWIAFRHRFTRDELVEKFGDIGNDVNLDATDDDDLKQERDEKVRDAFKTAEVWEFWCKDDKQVRFISAGLKEKPLQEIEDPLGLIDFWPMPRPLYSIENSASLIPVPLYELYREQAEELDRINNRINKIVSGLKLRGVFDSTVAELAEVMRGEDNDLIPAQNVTALIERGGLEKAIWMLPIEQAANVLKVLFEQREQVKQVIYEITGIADIIRGASVASETATAQQIKDKWGSLRIKRLQAEVARFIRDILRIQAELIGEKFSLQTLQTMTGLKFPTLMEKQQAQMMQQRQAMLAQQQGKPAPPPQQLPPAWEEIQAVLRDDKQRTFKVDVETDSTVAASVESDMAGLRDILQGVTQLVQGLGPAVQMGAMPVEALKEIILTVCRRSKMGNAVEDALDMIRQPPPQAQQQDNSAQVAQIKAQADQQIRQAEMQHEQAMEGQRMQLEQAKLQAETAIKQADLEAKMAIEAGKAQLEERKLAAELDIKRVELEIKQVELALKEREISMSGELEAARFEREGQQVERETADSSGLQEMRTMLSEMYAKANEPRKPRKVQRDQAGLIIAVDDQPVRRNAQGLIEEF